jgi:hypothetical protein
VLKITVKSAKSVDTTGSTWPADDPPVRLPDDALHDEEQTQIEGAYVAKFHK